MALNLIQAAPDGSNLKWKRIAVNEITYSRQLPVFIQWLTADHPSQDGKAVAAIEKMTIADTDHLSDSWFKIEILGGLNGADVEFIDPSANDGEYGINAAHTMMPSGVVTLDKGKSCDPSQSKFLLKMGCLAGASHVGPVKVDALPTSFYLEQSFINRICDKR